MAHGEGSGVLSRGLVCISLSAFQGRVKMFSTQGRSLIRTDCDCCDTAHKQQGAVSSGITTRGHRRLLRRRVA